MEEIRSSRRHAKSTYRDVFGGAPNYTSTYVSKSDEYREIFGGIATASSSIPFLDLPDSNGDDGNVGFVDYGEIFGGFDAGKFAVDYQELLKGSVNERTQMNVEAHETQGIFNPSTDKEMNDRVELLDKNKSSSSSNSSDYETRQFNMSYHRTTCGNIDDVLTGKTCVTEFHAVPEYSYSVDSCSSLQDESHRNSSSMQVKDHAHKASCNGQFNDMNQVSEAHPSDITHNKKRNVAKVNTCKEELSSKQSTSDDTSVHRKSHSRSSSNNSESSVNAPYYDAGFVHISNINLRTQPSRLPPPSRAPPKIAMKQENATLKEPKFSRGYQGGDFFMIPTRAPKINYSIGSSKSQEFQKNNTSFHDVEMDASSAIAASAAAMKEAMEQAQARLKSAKELMEKKRDKPQIFKKLSCKESTIIDEKKVSKGFEGDKVDGGINSSMKSLLMEKEKEDYMLDDLQTGIKVGKAAPIITEKESSKDDGRHMMQDDGFKDVSNFGEWTTEKQLFDLVDNYKSSDENLNTMINKNNVRYAEKSQSAYEFNDTSKLASADTIKLDELDVTSESVDGTLEEEIIQQQDVISELTNGDEEFVEAQEVLNSEPELTNGEDPCESNELEVDSNNDDPKLEEIYLDEKTIELHAVEEAWESYDNEKVLSPTFVSCGSENSLKMSETDVQLENVVDTRKEEVEELETFEEACLHENSECTNENGIAKSFHGEDECKAECSSSDTEHEKCRKTDAQETCMHDFRNEVAQCDNEQKENYEKADDTIITEEKMNSTLESEVQLEQKLEGTHSVVENTVELETLKFEYSESKNEEIKVASIAHSPRDKDCGPNSVESKNEEIKAASKAHSSEDKDSAPNGYESENEEIKAASKACNSEDNDCAPNGDESKNIGDDQQEACAENEESVTSADNIYEKPQGFCCDSDKTIDPAITANISLEVGGNEHSESEKAKAEELEMARKAEEEKKRERERERVKERIATEQRLAKERAERIAVEWATAEARQRALAEAKEKAERAAAEALERSLAEKALKEAKLRAERAAVERATAEARERAVEKALADKAAADARLRASRINNSSRDKPDTEIKTRASYSDVVKDVGTQNGSSQKREDSSVPVDVESPLRCKAKHERHQRTVERAAKALAEKNMRDILAQREQAERNRLSESLDADVRRWSTGKEGNLRALLSTLQYILGSESGWQPIPLTDVITAAAVKKAYRKATLYVHPDKLQQRGASIQQKYICEKVFDLLKEAWNRFNSEER